MPNVTGKSYHYCVVTPMKPWKGRVLTIICFLLRTFGFSAQQLRVLKFVHAAGWYVVGRRDWPGTGANPSHYAYLLFCSNFDGSWDEYFEDLVRTVGLGIFAFWIWSEGYPGLTPISKFKTYARDNQIEAAYSYSAFPGQTTRDICDALELRDSLAAWSAEHESETGAAFVRAYQRWLAGAQYLLANSGGSGPAYEA